jgi:hypothetical protein
MGHVGQSGNLTLMAEKCDDILVVVRKTQAYDALPDNQAQKQWADGLAKIAQGSIDCADGIHENDAGTINQAGGEITGGYGELQAAGKRINQLAQEGESPPNYAAADSSSSQVLTSADASISVAIPSGWHQISNPENPKMSQMVYPMSCPEVSARMHCAGGIARISTNIITDKGTIEQFAAAYKQGLSRNLTIVTTVSEGDENVAGRPGYRCRFIWSAQNERWTGEFVIVPTGPPPSSQGASGRAYSEVLVTTGPGQDSPRVATIDSIIDSIVIRNK